MSTIKNLHRLEIIVDEPTRSQLDSAALPLKMDSNVTFKILDVDEHTIVVMVKQEKHPSENYFDRKTLVMHTRALFGRVLPGWKIHPQAIPFKPNPISDINGPWVKKKMDQLNIRVTDIVEDTGVDKTNISAWANSTRPMSQPVKAMFFYYFKVKGIKS